MPETRICDACGDTVTRSPSHFNGKRTFCDMQCMSEGYDERLTLKCEECGESFKRTRTQVEGFDTHYCSNSCMYDSFTGEDAPNWRGGHDNFSTQPESREWRENVFSRDSYECQDCGRTNCRLNAHHILGRSEHPEKSHDVDNGLTLCLYCHSRRHFEKREMGAYRLIKGNIKRLSNV